jgi:UDP-N-acetylglucosamine 2-epimerase
VEAGLRSFDPTAPEEKNRIIADHLSDWRFCPTQSAIGNLREEGIRSGIFGVGDLMYEHWREQHSRKSTARLPGGICAGEYCLVTAHRAENVDSQERLSKLVRILKSLDAPVVFPVHPRTRRNLNRLRLWSGLQHSHNVDLISPVTYSESLALISNARIVLTDSGGVQREAHWSGVRCFVLRDTTEWPELLESGKALVGLELSRIRTVLSRPRRRVRLNDRVFLRRNTAKAIIRRLEHEIHLHRKHG